MSHPFYGKRTSEVKVNELHALSAPDFVSYTNWLVQVRLDYLIAEGFIDVVFDEDEVPSFNCLQEDGTRALLSETEVEDSILEILLVEVGRYI